MYVSKYKLLSPLWQRRVLHVAITTCASPILTAAAKS